MIKNTRGSLFISLAVAATLKTACGVSQSAYYNGQATVSSRAVSPGASAPLMTLPYASVTVCTANTTNPLVCGSAATVYVDKAMTTAITQPFYADAQGNFGFFAPTGQYLATITGSNGQTTLQPVTVTGAGPATVVTANGANGNFAVTGNLTAQTTNGVINAAAMPGNDIGAQVAAAAAILGSTCGTIIIPNLTGSSTYTWTTPVTILPCITIDGQGSSVNTANMGTTPFLIRAQAATYPATNGQLAQGGVKNITFIGPGPNNDVYGTNWTPALVQTIGIQNGTSNTSTFSAISNYTGLHMRHFGTAMTWQNAFQDAFFGGSFEDNFDAFGFPGNQGIENINFHGTQILNNVRWGINGGCNGANPEIGLFGVSMDYNGQVYTVNGAPAGGQIKLCGGSVSVYAGHMESRQNPFIVLSGNGGHLALANTVMSLIAGSNAAQQSYIQIASTNAVVDIHDFGTGVTVTGNSIPSIPSLIDFTGAGADNHLSVTGYAHGINGARNPLPILKSGQAFQYFNIPVLNVAGDTVGVSTNFSYTGFTANRATFNLGISPGNGVQHIRNAGACSASGAVGATCTSQVILWAVPFQDTNYTLNCTIDSPTGHPFVSSIATKTTTSFSVNIGTADGNAAGGNLECTALHD